MLPRPTTLEEWGSVFTNVGIWHEAVTSIMASEGLSFTVVTAGFPGSNAVFLADEAYVVKIFAPMFEADYAKELAVYRLISDYEDIAAPTLVAHGCYEDGNSWPYLITTYCHGVAMRDARHKMQREGTLATAEQLGKMIRTLHSVVADPKALVPLSWDSYFQDRILTVISALREKSFLASEVITALEEHLYRAKPFLQEAETTLVHADLTEDHLLLYRDGNQWSLSSLIDFADGEIAPREYEWIPLWFDLYRSDSLAFLTFMHSYDSELELDEDWRDRMLAMTFLHRYGVPIVASSLGDRAKEVSTLEDLKDALWPRDLLRG